MSGPLNQEADHRSAADAARGARFRAREADWRQGAVIYQVFVDRFAPSADLAAKAHLYPSPKRLRGWDEQPRGGHEVPEAGLWTHELEFWGGDLTSARTRLDHLEALGVDVLYLNPIHAAYTNHKYDAEDYFAVSPEYGTRADVAALADDLHARGMKLVLDGVFNHVGRRAPWFQQACAGQVPIRNWFYLGEEFAHGYRAWFDVGNLPELRLEDAGLRERLWGAPDSVVQSYLREEGIDGWRLDVAFDIGFRYLSELCAAAHRAKPGSLVVGEVWNYPPEWLAHLDGIFNMTIRELILALARGQVSGAHFARATETLVGDAGLERLLRCWLVLDNHDTPRLATELPEPWQRELAQVLQLTLPGAPQLYYGVEAGMTGGPDPEMRGPMDWERAVPGEPEFDRLSELLAIRRERRALRVGDFVRLDSESLLAFARKTDRVSEAVFVIANPSDAPVRETLVLRDSKLMSHARLRELRARERHVETTCGLARVELAPREVLLLGVDVPETHEYTPYKRIQ